MTTVNAMVLASGYTYRARTSRITVEPRRRTLVAGSDAMVLPGEIITVPERLI